MHSLRKRIFVCEPQAIFTYGSQTTPARKALGLAKSHVNDAIAISGATKITEAPARAARIIQVRSKKRSLHEATPRKGRKEPNRTQKRAAKNTREKNGFHLSDTVIAGERRGYITGFSGNNAYIKDMDGNYICQSEKSHKQFRLSDSKKICSNRNWVFM